MNFFSMFAVAGQPLIEDPAKAINSALGKEIREGVPRTAPNPEARGSERFHRFTIRW